jgi:hypothetical protein
MEAPLGERSTVGVDFAISAGDALQAKATIEAAIIQAASTTNAAWVQVLAAIIAVVGAVTAGYITYRGVQLQIAAADRGEQNRLALAEVERARRVRWLRQELADYVGSLFSVLGEIQDNAKCHQQRLDELRIRYNTFSNIPADDLSWIEAAIAAYSPIRVIPELSDSDTRNLLPEEEAAGIRSIHRWIEKMNTQIMNAPTDVSRSLIDPNFS